jgi:hypothetical protein
MDDQGRADANGLDMAAWCRPRGADAGGAARGVSTGAMKMNYFLPRGRCK